MSNLYNAIGLLIDNPGTASNNITSVIDLQNMVIGGTGRTGAQPLVIQTSGGGVVGSIGVTPAI